MNEKYLPEGMLLNTPENKQYTESGKGLEAALRGGVILEGAAVSCNNSLDLTVALGEGIIGVIPRAEATLPLPDRREKDIAIISRVGKAVCFKVLGFKKSNGCTYALLSRRAAQEDCYKNSIRHLSPGDILPVRITHEENFGAFVDIGCGIVSLLSIDCISVSRIAHPRDRFAPGDYLRAAVKSVDRLSGRVYVTTKELYGTWQENADLFEVGQTVTGIVRSIEDYGIFVELTPNLAGLAEYKEGMRPGEGASVYIKSINPEKMKVKLALIDSCPAPVRHPLPRCFLPEEQDRLTHWRYSPPECERVIETVF